MSVRKKNPFKTLVLSKGAFVGVLYLTVALAVMLAAVLFLRLLPEETISRMIMDSFFKSEKAYAEIAEIFTDSKGRVNAIMEGYTMVIGKKRKEITTPEAKTETTPVPTPETPKITESTSTSLAEIKNQSGKSADTKKLAGEELKFKAKGEKPKVLIIHTHTTESYFEQDRSIDE
ncbi:MAG: stage II sporulation protein P, partial [Clostridia bacterium]|nr:stage II sporulation protein P [Clostridia bacterium]